MIDSESATDCCEIERKLYCDSLVLDLHMREFGPVSVASVPGISAVSDVVRWRTYSVLSLQLPRILDTS